MGVWGDRRPTKAEVAAAAGPALARLILEHRARQAAARENEQEAS